MTLTGEQLPVELKSRLMSDLRTRGFRLTPQREKILDMFFELPRGEHLSAEELHQHLRQRNLDISLATTYRTLKLLVSVGVLRELDFTEDHKHYELLRNPESPHHHIICVTCGQTGEFDNVDVTQLATEMAEKENFQLVDVQFKLFGLCLNCVNDD